MLRFTEIENYNTETKDFKKTEITKQNVSKSGCKTARDRTGSQIRNDEQKG